MLLGLAMMIWIGNETVLPARALAGFFSSPVKQGIDAYAKKDFQQAKKAFIDAQLERPEDLRLYYNIGAAAYGAGEFDLAETNFLQAARTTDTDLRQKSMYNLANTRYRRGDLAGAVQGYEALLKEFPDDVQAKENLAFVKQKQEEEKQQQKQKEKDDRDNKENQDQDEKKDQKEKDAKNEEPKNQGQKDPNSGKQKSQGDKKEDTPGKRPPDPQPDQGDEQGNGNSPGGSQNQQAQAANAKPAQAGKPDVGAQLLENRLNRLEDKPGMALSPRGGRPQIEKDW